MVCPRVPLALEEATGCFPIPSPAASLARWAALALRKGLYQVGPVPAADVGIISSSLW